MIGSHGLCMITIMKSLTVATGFVFFSSFFFSFPFFPFFFFFFFSLSHSFFLSFSFFFPFDTLNGVSSNACRSGPGQATKTVVEGYPPNPDPRVSQIRFICRIVCGLKEK